MKALPIEDPLAFLPVLWAQICSDPERGTRGKELHRFREPVARAVRKFDLPESTAPELAALCVAYERALARPPTSRVQEREHSQKKRETALRRALAAHRQYRRAGGTDFAETVVTENSDGSAVVELIPSALDHLEELQMAAQSQLATLPKHKLGPPHSVEFAAVLVMLQCLEARGCWLTRAAENGLASALFDEIRAAAFEAKGMAPDPLPRLDDVVRRARRYRKG